MRLGKNAVQLVNAVADMEEADYSKIPELGVVYQRLKKGREQFRAAFDKDISALMQVSALDLLLHDNAGQMIEISHNVADATEAIFQASSECSAVAGKVNGEHEELTNTIINASGETEQVFSKIEESQNELTKIKGMASQTIQESKELQKDMNDLTEVINRMTEVIGGINSISSQTNLLALNASIEAARAGDAGKGFAVVAEEIRKLAEETQTLTSNMGGFVEGIRNASQKSIKSAASTIQSLDVVTEKIERVWEMNQDNEDHVSKVNNSVSSLAAVSEELSSSMTELEEQTLHIQEQCDRIKEDASQMHVVSSQLDQVIRPIEEIEKDMDDAAKMMGTMTDDIFYRLGNKKMAGYFDNAITAHTAWLANLKKMVDERTIFPIQLDASKCGFGHFYYSLVPKDPQIREIWDALEEKHKKFHHFGSDVQNALFQEEYSTAEQYYREAEQYSKELISDLEKMKQIAEKS